MDDRSICSSEDLTLFSNEYGSSSNVEVKLRCASFNNYATENKSSNMFIENSQNMRRFSSAFINSLRRNTNDQANKKIHHDNVNNSKNLLKVPAQKLKLMDEEEKETRSFSLTSSRISPSSKKECQQNAKEKNFKEPPLIFKPHNKSNSSKFTKRIENIEIEVFMPIIDERKNTIFYPNSKKPVIKRYFTKKASPKSNEPDSENKCINKSVNESARGKNMKAAIKRKQKSENSCKNVNSSENKADVQVAKMFPAIELKSLKTPTLEKRKAVSEMQTILMGGIVDIENVPAPKSDVKAKHTCSLPIMGAFGILVSQDLTENQNKRNKKGCLKNSEEANECVFPELDLKSMPKYLLKDTHFSSSSDIELIKETLDLLEKVEELKNRTNKNYNLQESATKPNYSDITLVPSKKKLNHDRNILEKKDSNSSTKKKVARDKRDQNTLIKPVYTGSKESLSINKCPRRLESYDGLSTESWIDRSKYLQARQEFLGKYQSSRWRTS